MTVRNTGGCIAVGWDGGELKLYAPWLTRPPQRAELGACVRLRDPRVPVPRCVDDWLLWQSGLWPTIRWRWFKAHVGWPRHRGWGMVEVETHLTGRRNQRIRRKAFARIKVGRGGTRS